MSFRSRSLSHCTIGLDLRSGTENTMKLISKEVKIKECGFLSIKKTKLEYLSSIVFHTVINLKLGKTGKNQEIWLHFYIEDNN